MPRPKKPGAQAEAKKRSRNGCWPCKGRKVKCDEARPSCLNCQRQGETCDYSIRLNWNGRGKKGDGFGSPGQINFSSTMISTAPRPRSTESGKNQDGDSDYDNFSYQDSGSTRLDTPVGPDDHHQDTRYASSIDPSLTESEQLYPQSYGRYQSPPPGDLNSIQQPAISRLRNTISPTLSSPASTDSAFDSSSAANFTDPISVNHLGLTSVPTSFPTLQNDSDANSEASFDRMSKRIRLEYHNDDNNSPAMPPPLTSSNSNGSNIVSTHSNLSLINSGFPLTPSASSTHSEEYYKAYPSKLSSFLAQENSEVRRLSVESLLSGPPGMPGQPNTSYAPPLADDTSSTTSLLSYNVLQEEMTTWGVDRGFKDWDIGMNDDANAISGGSPVALREHRELVINEEGDYVPLEFGFGVSRGGSIVGKDTAFDEGGYYARPVTIKIPRSFEPLPPILLENPMNLLYFHHYINHTARILVPHHCSANPFQNILPVMALEDGNLMNLLLAYSAAHRARLLQQPEPATRIALFVQDIFPTLRHALDDPSKIVTNANLATAIMLASLEIISPKAFGISIPWQRHLDTASQIIAARGGPKAMQRERSPVSYFLLRWFGYLEVLGSLVGSKSGLEAPTRSDWASDYDLEDENDYKIDCLLGFTSRCVGILAKIAQLARICDAERIDEDHNIRPEWQPSDDIRERAEKLIVELEAARTSTKVQTCPHLHSVGEIQFQWDEREMAATNDAFHWAGLVHIQRRILGKPSSDPDVSAPVNEIIAALEKVRKGSTAEGCLLFPMFTAGCDIQDEKQRHLIMDRFKGVEEWGMSQVYKARRLVEKVWETGKPWETLVSGEFVG